MEDSGCRCEAQDLGSRYRVPDVGHRTGTVEAFTMWDAGFRMQTQDLRKKQEFRKQIENLGCRHGFPDAGWRI